MGDIKRKRRLFKKPRKPFELDRIKEENQIVEKYGLKNKREVWKANATVSVLRTRAKKLISKSPEEKEEFFERLKKQGYDVNAIAEVLALTRENLLERRLQTIVFQKGLANTSKQARQFIVHKLVLVDGKVVNSPSFHVSRELENSITIKERRTKEIREAEAENE